MLVGTEILRPLKRGIPKLDSPCRLQLAVVLKEFRRLVDLPEAYRQLRRGAHQRVVSGQAFRKLIRGLCNLPLFDKLFDLTEGLGRTVNNRLLLTFRRQSGRNRIFLLAQPARCRNKPLISHVSLIRFPQHHGHLGLLGQLLQFLLCLRLVLRGDLLIYRAKPLLRTPGRRRIEFQCLLVPRGPNAASTADVELAELPLFVPDIEQLPVVIFGLPIVLLLVILVGDLHELRFARFGLSLPSLVVVLLFLQFLLVRVESTSRRPSRKRQPETQEDKNRSEPARYHLAIPPVTTKGVMRHSALTHTQH